MTTRWEIHINDSKIANSRVERQIDIHGIYGASIGCYRKENATLRPVPTITD